MEVSFLSQTYISVSSMSRILGPGRYNGQARKCRVMANGDGK